MDQYKSLEELLNLPKPKTDKAFMRVKVKCGKCNGTGYIPEYANISHGKCFLCKGKGFTYSMAEVTR